MEKVWNLEEEELEQNEDFLRVIERGVENGRKRRRCRERYEKGESERMRKRKTIEEDCVGFQVCQEEAIKKQTKGRKVKVARRKKAQKDHCSVEWSLLPWIPLEKVFSCLDWKDLGTAMLVCKRWQEVGGQPSLWTQFPLQLTGKRLKSFRPIWRLGWVKSLEISLSIASVESLSNVVQAAIDNFPRMKELFISCENCNDELEPSSVIELLEADNNKLERIGTRFLRNKLTSLAHYQYFYYLTSCDADSVTFVKKTPKVHYEELISISIFGLPGVCLTNEILETAFKALAYYCVLFNTNLITHKNMDLRKLACLLKDHVEVLNWDLLLEDSEQQEVAPLNAILDLLASKNNGLFNSLNVPKPLLLKSKWVGRLGGEAKLEAEYGDVVYINHNTSSWDTEPGLEMFHDMDERTEGVDDEEDSDDSDEEESRDENTEDIWL